MEEKTTYHCESMTARVAGMVLIVPVAAAAAIGFGIAEGVRAIKRNVKARRIAATGGIGGSRDILEDPKLVKAVNKKMARNERNAKFVAKVKKGFHKEDSGDEFDYDEFIDDGYTPMGPATPSHDDKTND